MENVAIRLMISSFKYMIDRFAYLLPDGSKIIEISMAFAGQCIVLAARSQGTGFIGGGNQSLLLQPKQERIKGTFPYFRKTIILQLRNNIISVGFTAFNDFQDAAFQDAFH